MIVFVSDAHIEGEAGEVGDFLAFLDRLKGSTKTLYILGDLFNLWLGPKRMTMPYQKPVIEAFHQLATSGIAIKYVEGNRDYYLAESYLGSPFKEVSTSYLEETIGGKRFYLSHGDLINYRDKPYRFWRKFSRSSIFYTGFNLLPPQTGISVANHLEKKLRGTNRKHKSYFPIEICKEYAHHIFSRGYDRIILGHFHDERMIPFTLDGSEKLLYILPDWKTQRKFLRFDEKGEGTVLSL
jgi:UDP-2,3-diacylglucosamine hydrolase